jgi:hypothetical protein
MTFANITLDVVTGHEHTKEFEQSSVGGGLPSSYLSVLSTETVTVSGKRYFTNYQSYEQFRSLFTPIPPGVYLYTSPSFNVLDLDTVNVGAFERDNNYADTTKRYSASVTLTFIWRKTIEQVNYATFVNYFGVTFYKVPNINFSASVDDYGSVNSRSISVNGQILDNQLTAFKSLLGSKVDFGTEITNLYVTSTNISSVDTVRYGASTTKLYTVSISAAQLDQATQAVKFIAGLFQMDRAGAAGTSYATDTIQFENITSLSKSISNRWDTQSSKFIVTSINLSVSGDVFTSDDGQGKPVNANKMIDLFNKIDALLTAGKSERAANVHSTGDILPSNVADVKYMLSNISVGEWQPAIAPEVLQASGTRPTIQKGVRYWRQNVSVSATAVYDLSDSGSNNDPVYVDTLSQEIQEEVAKYTQIQVLGFGTVFKRIGTQPGRASVTQQRQYRDNSVYVANQYGGSGSRPAPTGWAGYPSKSVVASETREQNPPTNRWTVEYEATEKLS